MPGKEVMGGLGNHLFRGGGGGGGGRGWFLAERIIAEKQPTLPRILHALEDPMHGVCLYLQQSVKRDSHA